MEGVADGIRAGRTGVGNDLDPRPESQRALHGERLPLWLVMLHPRDLSANAVRRGSGRFVILLAQGHRSRRGAEHEGGFGRNFSETGCRDRTICGMQ